MLTGMNAASTTSAFTGGISHLGKKSLRRGQGRRFRYLTPRLRRGCGKSRFDARRRPQIGETVTTYDSSGVGTVVENRGFVYDGDQIALQFDKSGAGSLAATDLSQRYLWGPAVNQLLAQETPGAAISGLMQAGAVDWALTDNLGSVRDMAVYNATTGVTNIAMHRVYDAYGNMTSQTNPSASLGVAAVDSLFGYTGKAVNKATGLQNNLNRWFDPSVGTWLSEDPAAADENLYRYAGNGPTDETDPSGLRECDDRLTARTANLVDVSKELEDHVNEIISNAWRNAQSEVKANTRERANGTRFIRGGLGTDIEEAGNHLLRNVFDNLGADEPGSGVDVTGTVFWNGSHSQLGKIGVWLDNNLDPSKNQIAKITFSQSRYHRNTFGRAAGARIPWLYTKETANHGLAPTINVNGILMGTDKWEHFFQQGYWYYYAAYEEGFYLSDPKIREGFGKWLEGEDDPSTAQYESVYKGIFSTFNHEPVKKGIFGSYSTGVISHADMAANEQGYQFYHNLYEAFVTNPDGSPFRFSAIKYTTTMMNEQSNKNTFVHGLQVDDSLDQIPVWVPPPLDSPGDPRPPSGMVLKLSGLSG